VKVGILGGGQLGRMLALAGYPLGLTFRVLDPAPDACAGQVVTDHVIGRFEDEAVLKRFAEGLDVVTYEWENVPVHAVRYISRFVTVYPPVEALEVSQDRLLEKRLFKQLGIATAPFAAVDSREELGEALTAIGLPAVLKTRRGGYDGKGQAVLRTADDAEEAWAAMSTQPLVVEGFVPFARELSILAISSLRRTLRIGQGRPGSLEGLTRPLNTAPMRPESFYEGLPEPFGRVQREIDSRRLELAAERNPRGVSLHDFYPLVQNTHRDGILRLSRVPAPGVTESLQAEAEDIATRVLEATGLVGVLAIELFEHNGHLLANEMAPRVHNSGHWTIEGAETSQFENHLRAVCGYPLGSAAPKGHSAMVNLIGAVPELESVLRIPAAHLHLYGKEPQPGRKLGHITVRSDGPEGIETSLSQVLGLIENERG
jgi:5-(carboxyamino)imidazole ribonucleotide synthase